MTCTFEWTSSTSITNNKKTTAASCDTTETLTKVQMLKSMERTKETGQYEGRTRDLGVISTTL
jgi:hypothetical protein